MGQKVPGPPRRYRPHKKISKKLLPQEICHFKILHPPIKSQRVHTLLFLLFFLHLSIFALAFLKLTVKFPSKICSQLVAKNHQSVQCDTCDTWVHRKCNKIDNQRYTQICPK